MIDKSLAEQIEIYLRNNLSTKRFEHSMNVAKQAQSLAKVNNFDSEKAYFCGMIHDICKEASLQTQQKLVAQSELDVSDVEMQSTPLWHAIAGAEFLKTEFNITDIDIINSVRYHTVGRDNMTLLEKIIYLADLVSEDRQYEDVNIMRDLCFKNIDEAMFQALKFLITLDVEKGHTIPPSTFEAYNSYCSKYIK